MKCRITKTKRILNLSFAAVILICFNACKGTVNALDYSLENQLYGEQVTPMETPPEEEEAAATDNPENSPIPEEPPIPEESPIPEEPPTPEESPIPEESLFPEESPENMDEETAVFLYALHVSDQDGVPLPNVRVILYVDGELLYSALTDANGSTKWTLPTGCVYTAKAELDGYVEQENRSQASVIPPT